MSEAARKLFDSLAAVKNTVQAVAPGLQNLGPEMKAEFSRLRTQGAMELAGALFGGNAFVPYGPGQYTPTPSLTPEQNHAHTHDIQEQGRSR